MKQETNLPRNLGKVFNQYVEVRTTSIPLQRWIPSRTGLTLVTVVARVRMQLTGCILKIS